MGFEAPAASPPWKRRSTRSGLSYDGTGRTPADPRARSWEVRACNRSWSEDNSRACEPGPRAIPGHEQRPPSVGECAGPDVAIANRLGGRPPGAAPLPPGPLEPQANPDG